MNALSDVTIKQAIAECMRAQNHIGGTTMHNVCVGTAHYVPWGAGDWVLAAFGGMLMLTFACILAFGAKVMYDEWRGF